MFYVWYLRGAIFTQVRLLSLHTVNDTWATQQQLERGHFHKSFLVWCFRRLKQCGSEKHGEDLPLISLAFDT